MDVLTKILQMREARGWTEYRLSRESGIPVTTISSWYKKGLLPSLSSTEKICRGFGITLAQFFVEGETVVLLNEDQKALLEAWDLLPKESKQQLIAFMQGLHKN